MEQRRNQSIQTPRKNYRYRPELTDSDAVEIYNRVKAGEKQKNVADDYNVHPSAVSKLCTGVYFRHLELPPLKKTYKTARKCKINGVVYESQAAAGRALGVAQGVIYNRIKTKKPGYEHFVD